MKKLSLAGNWEYKQIKGKVKGKATVPGDIYKDLLDNKQIPDPFYRDNELQLQWIGESDWTFSRKFEVTKELLESPSILLHCDGLDTIATVSVNGKRIGKADNMFRVWEFDIKKALKKGTNTIAIGFKSAVNYMNKCGKELPLPGCTRNMGYIRKEQCNFGWDWGIKAVTCGIWRDIEVLALDQARIVDMQVLQSHGKKVVDLTVNMELDTVTRGTRKAVVTVSRDGKSVTQTETSLKGKSGKAELKVKNPELWWPNNLGDQPLYDVTIELLGKDGELLDTSSRRVGLRTLVLDRHKDKWGESFQFVVNGVPFFAKGANWIPADAIQARMTDARYRELVQAAADSNMNMLRVWGGGIYEDKAFYDVCDELGICIWQDFMYACGHYPVMDKEFMKNVKIETEDTVRRLRHHACMALWCGNNELEMGNVAKSVKTMNGWKGYCSLFDKLLGDVVAKLDPEGDYWPSSPHTPIGDRHDHNNPNSGDAHLWDVWHGRKPFEWYRTCEHRFNSEFGFQSFPEPKTVYGYTEEKDRNITSWVMDHHQRSWVGNTAIMQYMLDWFKLPMGFENILWASQILQGMAIKYACEHWRRSMPRGMGTLYWQINDTWPVASWASIDYHGRWKALHYMAKDFFEPLMVSGLEDPEAETVEVHVTNDRLKPQKVTAFWTITDLKGKVISEGSKKARAAASADTLVKTLSVSKELAKYGKRDVLVWLEMFVDDAKTPASRNLVLFSRPKHIELEEPKISSKIKKGKEGFTVTLSAKAPALWSWLELEKVDADYSTNFVHLRPGDPMIIEVKPKKSLTLTDFKKQLIIRSLVDTY